MLGVNQAISSKDRLPKTQTDTQMRVHLTFARAGIKFVVFCHHLRNLAVCPYRWICKYEMHPDEMNGE
ncbi:MAG: hypothetical protein GDA48_19595 [Hormoscilla sp. GM102CHS1]|nr:hypothetical protein [Hormoscilla sp. GM102CHS1]